MENGDRTGRESPMRRLLQSPSGRPCWDQECGVNSMIYLKIEQADLLIIDGGW